MFKNIFRKIKTFFKPERITLENIHTWKGHVFSRKDSLNVKKTLFIAQISDKAMTIYNYNQTGNPERDVEYCCKIDEEVFDSLSENEKKNLKNKFLEACNDFVFNERFSKKVNTSRLTPYEMCPFKNTGAK